MEIVIRAVVIYAVLWGLLRALGRRELGELSAFELLLVVVLGDLVQQGVTQEDYSVIGALLAVSTLAMLTLITSYLTFRFKRLRPPLEGRAVLVIDHGNVQLDVLRAERITLDELRTSARRQGIASLAAVEWGIIEASGEFSFVTASRETSPVEDTRQEP